MMSSLLMVEVRVMSCCVNLYLLGLGPSWSSINKANSLFLLIQTCLTPERWTSLRRPSLTVKKVSLFFPFGSMVSALRQVRRLTCHSFHRFAYLRR
ncbi:hypothetical protein BO71DRAFT_43293 [Aspergillus ellipticus CBS 707.79]|uniref:Uncharacterized protein n=1 Tax=Aspergillus ellipticus CBS 707.79 TaxID=1448320 RepID=A0A319EL24_9EURO|nr:hypothetical protein BO71DRAFT_43293 [Aspergillus ellipticus CBS 707.79]